MEHIQPASAPDTSDYYEKNADTFIASTLHADVSGLYEKFEKYIHPGCRILDLGCGSGRDSRYFTDKGYRVTAVDPSPEMCARARAYAKVPVYAGKAEELSFVSEFDAVWACASLLHVPREKLTAAMQAICRALVPGGILYCSFKYGDRDRIDAGRRFTDLNEEGLKMILQEVPAMDLIGAWVTADVRPERTGQKWLNALMRKNV